MTRKQQEEAATLLKQARRDIQTTKKKIASVEIDLDWLLGVLEYSESKPENPHL